MSAVVGQGGRSIRPFALLGIALLAQMILLAAWRPLGRVPDLVLLVVVVIALLRGAGWGGAIGFLGGMALDLSAGQLLGLGSATKMLTGMWVGRTFRALFPDNYVVLALAVFGGTVVDQTLYMLSLRAFGLPISLTGGLKGVVLPLAVMNSLIAIPFYPVVLGHLGSRPPSARRPGSAAWRTERRIIHGRR